MDWSTQTLWWEDIERCVVACFGEDPKIAAGVLMEIRKKTLVAIGVWVDGDVKAVCLVKTRDEADQGRRSLVIYALNGDLALEQWEEAFEYLCSSAKEMGCSAVRAETQIPGVERLAAHLGFKSQHMLWKEV